MKTCSCLISVLLFVATVPIGVFCNVANSRIIASEDLTRIEIIDESEDPPDSISTPNELEESVTFNLYTKSNPTVPQILKINDSKNITKTYFDPTKPTRFVIHGWLSSLEGEACVFIREAYLSSGDYNVLNIDWSPYANRDYVYARTKIVTVGQYVGQMIDHLENNGMKIKDLTIVGHSLGAHIAGVAGRTATHDVPSIIALDPAGPLFYFTVVNGRLRSTDASYVQVIHTNAGVLGYNGNLGDVDFWPNGGTWQSGCGFDVFGRCSHARSYNYFVESIGDSKNQFFANNCSSYLKYKLSMCKSNSKNYMGGSSLDFKASGNYYLTTNSASPYAKG